MPPRMPKVRVQKKKCCRKKVRGGRSLSNRRHHADCPNMHAHFHALQHETLECEGLTSACLTGHACAYKSAELRDRKKIREEMV